MTIDKINRLTISYLSVVGISDDKEDFIKDNNPILIYFYRNIVDKMPHNMIINNPSILGKTSAMVITDNHDDIIDHLANNEIRSMEDYENNQNNETKVSRILFYDIIKESYRIYKKLDQIISNQNQIFKQNLIDMVGGEDKYNMFIDNILEQYKDSLFNLVTTYNGKDEHLTSIKMNLLEEKMIQYGNEEDYDNAIKIQNKLKKITLSNLKSKIKKGE